MQLKGTKGPREFGQRRADPVDSSSRTQGLRLLGCFVCGLLFALCAAGSQAQDSPSETTLHDLTRLSLEELTNVEVTSVSKSEEKYTQVAAAVTVITQEDIRRSGVTSIPEVLRLVPGVQVADVDSNKWAVGIRGFASRLSRSMLVLMDGRSVYTPLFAGVYWEVQDTLLEDIERIEVIRGPGGTLWGANAVNGVINIITKDSKDTQGGLTTIGGGSYEDGFAGFRYGHRTAQGSTYRIYAKFFDRDASFSRRGNDFDSWRMGQAGFRTDSASEKLSRWTLQGDLYVGRTGQQTTITSFAPPFLQAVQDDAELSGGNILGHWQRKGAKSDLAFRFYYDRTNRNEPSFEETRDTVNLDFQDQLRLADRYHLTWGLGYEVSSGEVTSVPTIAFIPSRRTDNLYTGFVHTETKLLNDRIRLVAGTKLLHNSYSGFEVQPTARISWILSTRQNVWVSFTRAVRIPSRVEDDLVLTALLDPRVPSFARILATKSFDSEKLLAYEAGYRASVSEKAFLTFNLFYNSHPNLLSLRLGTPFRELTPSPPHQIVPFSFENKLTGESYGSELSCDWLLASRWRVGGAYSFLKIDLRNRSGGLDSSTSTEGASPRHQVSFQSLFDLPGNLELDMFLRHVSRLPSQKIDSYTTSDARFAWHPTGKVELSIVGRNLLQAHHPEFGSGSSDTREVKRSVYGKVTWHW